MKALPALLAGLLASALMTIPAHAAQPTQASAPVWGASNAISVISCQKYSSDAEHVCYVPVSVSVRNCSTGFSSFPCMTPAEFAARDGYKKIYRTGMLWNDGRQYILMEVSN